MADLRLTRDFHVSPERLFKALTDHDELMAWWGPEGMHIEDNQLDLSREGPWSSVMVNGDGGRFKVSGQVTHVRPPDSVGFTWAWHDENDTRGAESHVSFTVEAGANGGARLIVVHVDLADAEAAANHERGWISSLNCLEQHLAS